ncbi:MAG: SCO family protein [Planctomycetota bacterium]
MYHDPNSRKASQFERIVANVVGRRTFWIVMMAIVMALPLAKAFMAELPPGPPKIRQLTDFTLTNQDGKPFGTEILRGKLWVANFVFTNCASVCPKLTHAMAVVKSRSKNMKGAVQFVSISVDPARDTPAVLQEYVTKNNSRGDWHFLTGSVNDIRKLVIDGFKLGMGSHDNTENQGVAGHEGHGHADATEVSAPSSPEAELINIAHGQQLILVDKDLWIRGFYTPDHDGLDRLMLDMGLVANLEGVEMMGINPAEISPSGRNAYSNNSAYPNSTSTNSTSTPSAPAGPSKH